MNDTKTREHIIALLLQAAPHARVAHHIRGRIRLKFAVSAVKVLVGEDVAGSLAKIPGIRQQKFNPASGSVLVEYDPAVIAPDLWEELAAYSGGAGGDHLRERLAALWDTAVNGERGR
ncbi:MAG: hypothetical protein JW781_01030 [Deltaproteobacteria bacterium]|nr:hypothetical protein [Candidatus Anaeroferrophillacea bacterium]